MAVVCSQGFLVPSVGTDIDDVHGLRDIASFHLLENICTSQIGEPIILGYGFYFLSPVLTSTP